MKKILIISFLVIAVLTAVFFKDISRHIPLFFNYSPPADTSTIDQIKTGAKILLAVKPQEDLNGKPLPLSPEEMKNVQQSLADRLTQYGGLEYITTIQDPNHIEIQIADIDQKEAKAIWKSISYSMILTIHAGHPFYNSANYLEAESLAQKVADGEEIVPSYTAYPAMKKDENGAYMKDENGDHIIEKYYLVKRRAAVKGVDIEFAQASNSQPGLTEVTLNDKGTQDMMDFTKNLKQGDLIITLLDKTVVSAASLNAPMLGKRFVITGGENKAESQKLAEALNNPLENEIELIEIQIISK